ncbi:NADH:ubiquinone reductase (Na(+)-transporting) subunit F [Poseidonibacter ostreae]|uniref:2Fe-2S iron-sulfur cluster binding domain-containing protein n=1 Tax=Poseidonibacter ostreae TaxID=2654171 RepID=A0A6L4WNW9_9BACT|nr:2Fe-2S iron-sulfur cluster binding domain-containing protein [Poseidonibacter ostreae]KAB7884481.1 2Fe-2S iron-sulfur cluster binding domain-containing protein [Poseidonibacter ostreae]KAB7884583.1 2Fe-2S iron-sulfur cluster binding domain-containing protein [Poseidonibacter ostreae]KAB7888069.1 2Fe-2S iron-sulfur cluster binding domain-containing protein [Poseidonibacter ostreae]
MACKLEIEPTGDIVDIQEGQTLLDAALRQGVYLPHACNHGLCGTCKVEVLEGEVDLGDASPFALMESERDDGFCLACTATADEDVVIEAEIDVDVDARSIPIKDIMGTVVKREMLTPRILGLWIELDEEIDFQAGQYINYHVPGFDEPRAFSLANQPSTGKVIELNIGIIPDGEATPWIHNNVKVGDRRKITGPFGRFFVKRSAQKPMIFFAGGSGLSSPKSMILDELENGCTQDITLFHGARNEEELYYADMFRGLESKHENFRYIPVLSDNKNENWTGEIGFTNDVAKKIYDNQFAGNKAYLCGPPMMSDACITALMQGRLFEKDIHTEKFFSRADLYKEEVKSPLFKSI